MKINKLTSLTALAVLTSALTAKTSFVYNFTNDTTPEQIHVCEESDPHFEWIKEAQWTEHGLLSAHPIVFSAKTGEGDFSVNLEFEPFSEEQSLTVKAESRRLMVHSTKGEFSGENQFSFLVNVRNSELANGESVELNAREDGVWHWDNNLQIEINGNPSALRKITISPISDTPSLYLLGDSTVTDQTAEPWIGWGQMLPYFFQPTIVVANHAESGETLRKFQKEKRFQKVLETLKADDFVMLQFGHNDMKEKGEGIGAMLSYTDDLRSFVTAIQEKGAKPILLTSMKRRRFDSEGRQFATLKDYPLAVRRLASELNIPMIDLNLMSGVFYGALGPEDSKKAFVHYPAHTFPGQEKALKDDSHFNAYGGYELARCIVEGIKSFVPQLATHLNENIPDFDPSSPDSFDSIQIPLSPVSSFNKPEGS